MNYTKLLSLFVAAGLLTGCVINVDRKSASVHLDKHMTIPAQDLSSLSIDAGAGNLLVKGSTDATEISVLAKIRTTKRQNFELTLDRASDTAKLVAHHHSTAGYWVGSSPTIDLIVTVPASLKLDIEDNSGDISIQHMNNDIVLDDGSDDLEIGYVKGNIDLSDNSGDVFLHNISGNINLDDNSDDILIRDIIGKVYVDDGSGEMVIENVSGKATIDDGSGDIYVINTGGLTILDSGSGDLKISNIKGEVDIDS